MPSFLEISSDKLNRIIGTPNVPVIIDVRTAEDFAADPRLDPGVDPAQPHRCQRMEPRGCRHGCHRVPEGAKAQPWRGRLSSAISERSRKFSKEDSRRGCRPDGQVVPYVKLPARDAAGPYGLGDAGPSQDRPDRLPLADPAFRRSQCRLPVRSGIGSRQPLPTVSARRLSISRTFSGAIAASAAPLT